MQSYACTELDFCEVKLTEVFPFLVTSIPFLTSGPLLSENWDQYYWTWAKHSAQMWELHSTCPARCRRDVVSATPIKTWQLCQLPSDKHKCHQISGYPKVILSVKPSNYEPLFPKYKAAHVSIRAPEHFLFPSWKILKGAMTAVPGTTWFSQTYAHIVLYREIRGFFFFFFNLYHSSRETSFSFAGWYRTFSPRVFTERFWWTKVWQHKALLLD